MLAVMKKLTYDEEYNFENEVRILHWGEISFNFIAYLRQINISSFDYLLRVF